MVSEKTRVSWICTSSSVAPLIPAPQRHLEQSKRGECLGDADDEDRGGRRGNNSGVEGLNDVYWEEDRTWRKKGKTKKVRRRRRRRRACREHDDICFN